MSLGSSTGTARWPRSRATRSARSPSPASAARSPTSGCSRRCCPSKVVGIGRNYAAHAAEMGNDVPDGAADVPQAEHHRGRPRRPDLLPAPVRSEVHYEGELAVVIGRICRDVPREQATDVDPRLHGRQRRDRARPAAAATCSSPGPRASTRSARSARGSRPTSTRSDLDGVDQTHLNGDVVQDGRTSDMIFDVPTLVAYISSVMTLLPGDVILTGTPEGVGPMQRRRRGRGHRSTASAP